MEIQCNASEAPEIIKLLENIVVNKGLTFSAHLATHMDTMQEIGEENFLIGTSTNAISYRWRSQKLAEGFPPDRCVLTGQTREIAEFKAGEVYIDSNGNKISQNLSYNSYESLPKYPWSKDESGYDHPFWAKLERWSYWMPFGNIPRSQNYEIWVAEDDTPVDVQTAIESLCIPDSICQEILSGNSVKIADIVHGDIQGVAREWF